MIRHKLVSALKQQFPNRFQYPESSSNLVATCRNADPAIGELLIYDDGDEATLCIGEITHGHFNPYDASLTADELASIVVRDLIGFLDKLFTDRVYLWRAKSGGAGGWRVLKDGETVPSTPPDHHAFLWCGPLKR